MTPFFFQQANGHPTGEDVSSLRSQTLLWPGCRTRVDLGRVFLCIQLTLQRLCVRRVAIHFGKLRHGTLPEAGLRSRCRSGRARACLARRSRQFESNKAGGSFVTRGHLHMLPATYKKEICQRRLRSRDRFLRAVSKTDP